MPKRHLYSTLPGCFIAIVSLIIVTHAAASDSPRPTIHASDVVFMYAADNPKQYEAYTATVAGWGGRAASDERADGFKQRVSEAIQCGLRYCGSVDFLVDFGGFIDFRPDTFMNAVTRDLDGNPLQVPWLWDHKHKGNPSYWFCTNNPEYQAYLRDQARRACLAPIEGLHIDDYSGSSASSAYNGGCFCKYCISGFHDYLRKKYSTAQLNEMGIPNIEAFDYGAFLRAKGFNAQTYKSQHRNCPLIDEFQMFQNQQMKERITDIYEYAEGLRGMPLVRSINSSADSPRTLVPAPIIDYFCGEVPHHAASKRAPEEPVFVYKVVEALDRRQTATASGQDWAWIKANEKPGLVRTWIVQTYAFGSVFMVPHNQWCYTQELGTHWWHGKTEDFAWLYNFVRGNRSLLDGYRSLATTALVYSTSGYGIIHDAAAELSNANVPYAFIVLGNEELPLELTAETAAPFDCFVLGNEQAEREQIINVKKKEAGIVSWKEIQSLPDEIMKQVTVTGADNVLISLRYNPDDSNSPVVCHVLNQNYDPDKDDITPADFSVSIANSLLQKAKLSNVNRSAKIYAPKKEPGTVEIKESNSTVSFQIKNAGLWTIVELKNAL